MELEVIRINSIGCLFWRLDKNIKFMRDGTYSHQRFIIQVLFGENLAVETKP